MLLQVLEQGRFERLGSTKSLHVNVRIIAATNQELAQSVREGKFRKDLYFRLDDVERRHIVSILERTGWRVAGKGGAAEALGVRRTTLHSKMKKLGIDRPSSE